MMTRLGPFMFPGHELLRIEKSDSFRRRYLSALCTSLSLELSPSLAVQCRVAGMWMALEMF